VNGIDHFAPAGDLRLRIDAGHAGLPKPVAITGEASAINSPPPWRAGRNIPRSTDAAPEKARRAHPRQRRQHDAMLKW